MFRTEENTSTFATGLRTLRLIYHATVRDLRKSHRNGIIGVAINVFQTVMFVAAFYLLFALLGVRGTTLRGDFLLYTLTGIFLFLTFTKTFMAVLQSEGPTSAMMKHRPMNTFVAIGSSALSTLYIQLLSVVLVLGLYQIATNRVEIDDPVAAAGIFLLTWFCGVSLGMVLLAAKPWAPTGVMLVASIFSRINMFASGKMFVANALPPAMIAMFAWNPLFHVIDQMRGAVFINYTPQNSSLSFPIWISIAFLMLGLMGEFYTRKRASLSWSAAD